MIGILTLKNKDGFVKRDSRSKANILNEEFQSVFTKEYLGSTPNTSHKTTGPDTIPSFILKSAASELAPILTLLRHHLTREKCRQTVETPVFKKRRETQSGKLPFSIINSHYLQSVRTYNTDHF